MICDSRSVLNINIIAFNIFNLKIPWRNLYPDIKISAGGDFIEILKTGRQNLICIKSKNEPGIGEILIVETSLKDTQKLEIPVVESFLDSDKDGFPDRCELDSEEDRINFRRWYVSIALSQYYHKDDFWIERDCGGLVRFCFREALKKHNEEWLEKKKFIFDMNLPDVKKFNFPGLPIIKERIFRTNSNVFSITDTLSRDSIFVPFAEVKYLKDNNLVHISKNKEDAKPGDIIFFSNDVNIRWPYHTMIYIGNDKIGKYGNADNWIIYHTGPSDDKPGIMKKIKLDHLFQHPNKRWHPSQANPYFLGFFRWKIIN